MSFTFTITSTIPAIVECVYHCWLNGKEHARMTDSGFARASKKASGAYTAHDGYIFGKNILLLHNKKIVQSWRTTEFKKKDHDSILEVEFFPRGANTLVKLTHRNLPEMKYKSGWKEYYFSPMKRYFKSILE